MSGLIITVAQQKGGSGKTTVAAHLAVAFALGGKSVGLLDVDPQGSLGEWFERREDSEGRAAQPLYIVAEKILSETEPLPRDWAVDGTTGYDFMSLVNNLFVNNAAESELTRIFVEFTGRCGVDVVTMSYRDALGLPVADSLPYRCGVRMVSPYEDLAAVRYAWPSTNPCGRCRAWRRRPGPRRRASRSTSSAGRRCRPIRRRRSSI